MAEPPRPSAPVTASPVGPCRVLPVAHLVAAPMALPTTLMFAGVPAPLPGPRTAAQFAVDAADETDAMTASNVRPTAATLTAPVVATPGPRSKQPSLGQAVTPCSPCRIGPRLPSSSASTLPLAPLSSLVLSPSPGSATPPLSWLARPVLFTPQVETTPPWPSNHTLTCCAVRLADCLPHQLPDRSSMRLPRTVYPP
jgi:hypothetical protein